MVNQVLVPYQVIKKIPVYKEVKIKVPQIVKVPVSACLKEFNLLKY